MGNLCRIIIIYKKYKILITLASNVRVLIKIFYVFPQIFFSDFINFIVLLRNSFCHISITLFYIIPYLLSTLNLFIYTFSENTFILYCLFTTIIFLLSTVFISIYRVFIAFSTLLFFYYFSVNYFSVSKTLDFTGFLVFENVFFIIFLIFDIFIQLFIFFLYSS